MSIKWTVETIAEIERSLHVREPAHMREAGLADVLAAIAANAELREAVVQSYGPNRRISDATRRAEIAEQSLVRLTALNDELRAALEERTRERDEAKDWARQLRDRVQRGNGMLGKAESQIDAMRPVVEAAERYRREFFAALNAFRATLREPSLDAAFDRIEATSDEELLADAKAHGVDVEAEAKRVREMLLATAKRAREAKARLLADPTRYGQVIVDAMAAHQRERVGEVLADARTYATRDFDPPGREHTVGVAPVDSVDRDPESCILNESSGPERRHEET